MPRPSAVRPLPLLTAATLMLSVALPAAAQTRRADIAPADIEAATYAGQGDLPPGQSALTAKVQILLDRSGVSPGVVDGFRGGMSESAVKAFERMHGLPQDGRFDPQVWALLQRNAGAPLTSAYTITAADAEGLVDRIPTDYAEKAQMPSMGYTSVPEKLAERFHMDERFLAQLNPGAAFAPGETINITVPAKPMQAKALRVVVDAERRRVAAYDAGGRMVADYPATVGSTATPSPQGTHLVEAAVLNPDYTYNPSINFKQGDNDKPLRIPPGPNAPVGNVWIDLSKPTYGIHGTPTPSQLFVNQSNGCVRLTNWDAQELAKMVVPGQTVVDFLPPGVSIAEVTPTVEPTALPDMAEGTGITVLADGMVADAPAIVTTGRPVPRRVRNAAAAAPNTPLVVAVEAAVAAAQAVPVPAETVAPLPLEGAGSKSRGARPSAVPGRMRPAPAGVN